LFDLHHETLFGGRAFGYPCERLKGWQNCFESVPHKFVGVISRHCVPQQTKKTNNSSAAQEALILGIANVLMRQCCAAYVGYRTPRHFAAVPMFVRYWR
jgi:hypothetical protein